MIFQIRIFVFFILLSPVILILFTHWPQWPLDSETPKILSFTFLQALLSGLFSTLLGFMAAFGFIMNTTGKKESELWAMIPNFLPTLIVLISFMSFSQILNLRIEGLWGITVTHALINIGVSAIVLSRIMKQKILSCLELVFIEGAKIKQWMPQIFRLLISDIFSVFLFVFFVSFTSFSIPLILGKGNQTTIEVFIYEQIKINNNWGMATSLLILELTALFVMSLLVWKRAAPLSEAREGSRLWNFRGLAWIAYLPLMVILWGLTMETLSGLSQLEKISEHIVDILRAGLWTLFISFATSINSMLIMIFILAAKPDGFLGRYLYGIGVPSTVLVGYSLVSLNMYPSNSVASIMMVIALTLIFIPSLFRLTVFDSYKQLNTDIFVAQSLGASEGKTFFHVIIPQMLRQIVLVGQIAGFWACGEFALSSIFTDESFTLALITKDFMGSYYLGLAMLMIWLMLLVGAFNFYLVKGVGIVFSHWINKRL